MVTDAISRNASDLENDFAWLAEIIETRMKLYLGETSVHREIYDIREPSPDQEHSLYAGFLKHYHVKFHERILLLLCLAPHFKPQMLDVFFGKNEQIGRGFTEFGGLSGKQHGGFLPTGETFAFIMGGNDLERRFSMHSVFSSDHFFARHRILKLEPAPSGEPFLSGALSISRDIIDLFSIGSIHKPDLSMDFPARRISTQMNWEDLVIGKETREQLEEIKSWMEHGKTLLDEWGFSKKFRKGFRCLFYGPPGTGKSFAASLLGKYAGRDVYRIDLSLVISKYIGETEKNLSRIFDQAENKNWILFFDEADALFGKRTKVNDAHDRYANQEVSYLLQRIEDHDGIVILASNLKSNMDDAFTRRFESIIHFPLPDTKDRLAIWKNGFSEKSSLAEDVDLEKMAAEYEISGGAIMNIIRYASLRALKKQSNIIKWDYLQKGIRKELDKEGRTI